MKQVIGQISKLSQHSLACLIAGLAGIASRMYAVQSVIQALAESIMAMPRSWVAEWAARIKQNYAGATCESFQSNPALGIHYTNANQKVRHTFLKGSFPSIPPFLYLAAYPAAADRATAVNIRQPRMSHNARSPRIRAFTIEP